MISERDRIERLIRLNLDSIEPEADIDDVTFRAIKADVLRHLDAELVRFAAGVGLGYMIGSFVDHRRARMLAAGRRASVTG